MSKFNRIRTIVIKLSALLGALEDLFDEYPQLVEECAGLVEAHLDQAVTRMMEDSTIPLPLEIDQEDESDD